MSLSRLSTESFVFITKIRGYYFFLISTPSTDPPWPESFSLRSISAASTKLDDVRDLPHRCVYAHRGRQFESLVDADLSPTRTRCARTPQQGRAQRLDGAPTITPQNCAHFCAHPSHRSVAHRCQRRFATGPELFHNSQQCVTVSTHCAYR
jgi:hypothetical protein